VELQHPFTVEQDDHGHVANIMVGPVVVLHLIHGTERNEDLAYAVVNALNSATPEAKGRLAVALLRSLSKANGRNDR
jgi:hypothetical protein